MPAAPIPTARSTPFKASRCEEIAATGGANRPTTAPAAGISAMPLSKALSKAEAAAALSSNATSRFTTGAGMELETGKLEGTAESDGTTMSVEAAATFASAPLGPAAPTPAGSEIAAPAAPAAPATRAGATLLEGTLATAAASAEPICDPATAPVVAAPRSAGVFTSGAAPTGGNGVESLLATSALVLTSPARHPPGQGRPCTGLRGRRHPPGPLGRHRP